ncbi:Ubiquitin domain-containing protein [Sparassis crispa]|uniref:Ubiquitin domain-containing protein n=1 Tax=Sparassis crispa TaxID=139825 RepID=A0A401G4V4_9APHY|nr:Ubiquitin domain-containing protein [Sparassis crispa]GBE77193.1 Ubiquitin domain-containing protein [Sparassis crispa]
MSSESPSSTDIQINVKGPSELKLQITISTDKTVLELKQAIAEKSDVPADRQRLIYSGRVLKDEDALSTYKIQSAHTIHMVKGAARSAASSSQASASQPLPNMQAGQNPHDPLTQLNSHMGYGLMAGLNPFAELGVNPNDPNMMQTMMNSPQFLQQMSSIMSNPAVLDQIIASNPQLAAMGPQVREVFQSERFRQMMSNPETLRMMLQMSSMMRDAGLGPGSPGSGFPAPGLPSTARQQAPAPGAGAGAAAPPPQPFFNPFFPPAAPAPSGSTPAAPGAGGAPPAPGAGMFDPALMQQMLAAMGGDPYGYGGFGGLGGMGVPPATSAAPVDARPPEERFQVQLQQLQDMGFTNASQNVRALLATGGNVNSAIEYILNGGGL